MKVCRNTKLRHIVAFLMLMAVCPGYAQTWEFDVASIEAYIHDHKSQRSLLLARSALEMGNELLHDYSSSTASDYSELNIDLDKYTRAFDVIDILYQSTRTALNVRDTYGSISENVGKYKTMLTDFHNKCLKRGNIETADTIIVTINLHCLKKIASEAENLYGSMADLVLYASGAAACSTADLLAVIECVNRSLDNIRLFVNTAYFETWRYIQVRMGYWKSSVYRSVSLKQIVDGAFGRWRGAGYLNRGKSQ